MIGYPPLEDRVEEISDLVTLPDNLSLNRREEIVLTLDLGNSVIDRHSLIVHDGQKFCVEKRIVASAATGGQNLSAVYRGLSGLLHILSTRLSAPPLSEPKAR